jgi:anti-sigma factor RsiW
MTGWSNRIVRHIPEDELHAYLDQALSRSQCVEIESHLAECHRCQAVRDDGAALRDRTTALLARIGPGSIVPPAYASLRQRYEIDLLRRRQWLVRAGWAASLVAALGFGWQANRLIHANPGRTDIAVAPPVATRPQPATLAVTAPVVPATRTAASAPAPRPGRTRHPVALGAPVKSTLPVTAFQATEDIPDLMIASYAPPPQGADQASHEVFSVETDPSLGAAGLQGLWRSVPLDGSASAAPSQLPRVPGLPVVQIQVQPGAPGAEVTAVDQQLDDGQLIRTIEGPASRVTSLLADQDTDAAKAAAPAGNASTPDKMTLTLRQGDRMLAVTGPSKVLGSLMSRVSLRRRY